MARKIKPATEASKPATVAKVEKVKTVSPAFLKEVKEYKLMLKTLGLARDCYKFSKNPKRKQI
jgi:hypothetical protein